MFRFRRVWIPLACGVAAVGCATSVATRSGSQAIRIVRELSHDSLAGRLSGTDGSRRAARIIANEMRRVGLTPRGDSGFLQRVPMPLEADTEHVASVKVGLDANGVTIHREITLDPPFVRYRPRHAMNCSDGAPFAPEPTQWDANIVGYLKGADRALRDEIVVVSAHYDHIGMEPPAVGDSVNNGADDDASGVAAMLEVAASLRRSPPRRSILFVAFTGEEYGCLGSRWFLANAVVDTSRIAANIQLEMFLRPDSMGRGALWLSGFERSTIGEQLATAGLPITPGHPRWYTRSDNIRFGLAGIPAHALSSYGGHAAYHDVTDEIATIDAAHFLAAIEAATRAVRSVADGPRPRWLPGGRP